MSLSSSTSASAARVSEVNNLPVSARTRDGIQRLLTEAVTTVSQLVASAVSVPLDFFLPRHTVASVLSSPADMNPLLSNNALSYSAPVVISQPMPTPRPWSVIRVQYPTSRKSVNFSPVRFNLQPTTPTTRSDYRPSSTIALVNDQEDLQRTRTTVGTLNLSLPQPARQVRTTMETYIAHSCYSASGVSIWRSFDLRSTSRG